jgi:hypothetical protein
MSWLEGWTYRKAVTLSRASGAVTNYQMKLLVGESSGATGENVDCGGLCASDFDDLRFTAADGTTLLDYWIESVSGATPNQLATIWIEFDSIGTGATTFYMYYGNSDAAAVSNGANTFLFFDHFEGSSLNGDNWFHWLNNGTTGVSGSILTVTGHASYNAWGCKQKFGTDKAFRGRVSVTSETPGGNDNLIFGIDDRSDDGTYVGSGTDSGSFYNDTSKRYLSQREGTANLGARSDSLSGGYNILEVIRNSTTNLKLSIGDSIKNTKSANFALDTCGFLIYSNTASWSISWDWVAVREYRDTGPAWGAWGDEELNVVSVNMGVAALSIKAWGVTSEGIANVSLGVAGLVFEAFGITSDRFHATMGNPRTTGRKPRATVSAIRPSFNISGATKPGAGMSASSPSFTLAPSKKPRATISMEGD